MHVLIHIWMTDAVKQQPHQPYSPVKYEPNVPFHRSSIWFHNACNAQQWLWAAGCPRARANILYICICICCMCLDLCMYGVCEVLFFLDWKWMDEIEFWRQTEIIHLNIIPRGYNGWHGFSLPSPTLPLFTAPANLYWWVGSG